MTYVGNINAHTASISTNFSRTNPSLNFNSTVNKQSKWQRGGPPPYSPLADNKLKTDELKSEPAKEEDDGDVKSPFGVPQTWQQFYAPGTSLPKVDYFQLYREAMLFKGIQG